MTQAVAEEDRYLADFQAFEKTVTGSQPEWVRHIRNDAWGRFAALGFPTARRGNEKWKYTNVAPIAKRGFEYPFHLEGDEANPEAISRMGPWDASWVSLVFIDGHYSGTLAATPHANGIRATNLAEAIASAGSDQEVARGHLARYADSHDDAFVALNTAFVRDGAYIHVPQGHTAQSPLHLLYVATNRAHSTASHPRILVVAAPHSKLTVVESYLGLSRSASLTNAVTEIVVEEGAQVEHYRLLLDSPESFHVGTTRVHQGQDSAFFSASLSQGAALTRNDLTVTLDAPGSSCTLNGLYMTTGTEHIDNYINIDHAKPNTTSRLYYKGILDGKSKAVFGGTILVREDAQKADAQQSDKNLLLSEGAEVDSKPSLLIYADDVKCGHGATAGHVDEDTIFYLRSRGLDLKTARRLLVHGFANEILETLQLEPFRAYVDRMFLEALPLFRPGGRS